MISHSSHVVTSELTTQRIKHPITGYKALGCACPCLDTNGRDLCWPVRGVALGARTPATTCQNFVSRWPRRRSCPFFLLLTNIPTSLPPSLTDSSSNDLQVIPATRLSAVGTMMRTHYVSVGGGSGRRGRRRRIAQSRTRRAVLRSGTRTLSFVVKGAQPGDHFSVVSCFTR